VPAESASCTVGTIMRSLRRLLASWPLLVVACARPAPHVPAPAVTVTAAPPAPPPASSPPAAKPAPPPLPSLDTPELDAQLAFLVTVCRAAISRDPRGRQRVGCAACLTSTDPAPELDGTIVLDADREHFYALRTLVRGSFTRAGATQIAASLDGCESHAENYGGMLVAEAQGASWARVRYDSGMHPETCLPFRHADGHDLLVCRWQDGHQSFVHDRLVVYDLEPGTVPPDFEIVTMNDDALGMCFMGAPPGEEVRAGQVEGFTLRDEDGDGTPDLVVEVSQRKARPGGAYRALCKKAIEALETPDSSVDVRPGLGELKKRRLVFTYDGKRFVPTRETAKVLRGL